MLKKQTAVEWFAEITAQLGYISTDILEQAKEMEKEQIIEAYNKNKMGRVNYGEQHYIETYKQD